jgi:hypothetical protein
MTDDQIECTEEGGTEPAIAQLRSLAAALDADVRLTPDTTPALSSSNPRSVTTPHATPAL